MKINVVFGFLLLTLLIARALGKELSVTVVYDDKATEINPGRIAEAGKLWITTTDLTRATRFEVKPQGVCRDELCFPLPKGRMSEFVRKENGKTWFSLTAFAGLVHQPVAVDNSLSAWYFGLRSDQQQRLESLQAPNFTLPDMAGKMHSLSDYRGKKVFLITWASW